MRPLLGRHRAPLERGSKRGNDNYKHLVPPGPGQCSSSTLLPHYPQTREGIRQLFWSRRDPGNVRAVHYYPLLTDARRNKTIVLVPEGPDVYSHIPTIKLRLQRSRMWPLLGRHRAPLERGQRGEMITINIWSLRDPGNVRAVHYLPHYPPTKNYRNLITAGAKRGRFSNAFRSHSTDVGWSVIS
jgi:hypothetical protein